LEQLRVAWYYATAYENKRYEFQAMLEGDKAKIQKEKEQLLAEQIAIKEVVSKALSLCQAWHKRNMRQLRFK
jgi:hypothetical protein